MPSLFPPSYLPIGFQVAGATLALPCLAVLGAYLRVRLQGRPEPRPRLLEGVKNPDGVLLLLAGLVRTIDVGAGALGGLGRAFLAALAVASGIGLCVAAGLWWTGRGLAAEAPWARPAAFSLLALVGGCAAIAALGLRGPARAIAFAILALVSVAAIDL